MKKYILKILIIILLFASSLAFALEELGCESGNLFNIYTGQSCTDTGGGSGSGTESGTSGYTFSGRSLKSDLFVTTEGENNVTYTSATLHGRGGDRIANPTLPITAYFRYSKSAISPIFCNDIYGTKMIATKDINLGITSSKTFSQQINNLTPDTKYYYCAIISNRENIAYGGSSIVKEFHTSPYATTIRTTGATSLTSNSAKLNGTYSSRGDITVYFEYKKIAIGETPSEWSNTSDQVYRIGSNANIYGETSANLSRLEADTRYQFRIVGKNNSGVENRIVYGSTLSFITSNDRTGDGGDGTGGRTGGGGSGTGGTGSSGIGGSGSGSIGGTGGTSGIGTGGFGGSSSGGSGTIGGTGGTSGIGTGGFGGSSSGGSGTGGFGSSGVGGSGTGFSSGGTSGGSGGGRILNNTTPLVLGQITDPPIDAIVRYHEGIETVFVRQIIGDVEFAKMYGYKEGTDLQSFAWNLADVFARAFGYVNGSGREIRVSLPDVAAYQLQFIGNKLTVYEYYYGRIVDVRNVTAVFKNASGYEYYFRK